MRFLAYEIAPCIPVIEDGNISESLECRKSAWEAVENIHNVDPVIAKGAIYTLYGEDEEGLAHAIGDFSDWSIAAAFYMAISGKEIDWNKSGARLRHLPGPLQ